MSAEAERGFAGRLHRKGIFVTRKSIVSWPGWPGSTISDVFVSYQQGDGRQAETVASCANDWLILGFQAP